MKVMTLDEAAIWLEERNLPMQYEYRQNFFQLDYSLPQLADHKTRLAKIIASDIYQGSEVLMCVLETGIWPSCELTDSSFMFEKFRASAGDDRPLDEARNQLFGPEDQNFFEGLLALALYFFWDFILIDSNKRYIIFVSHDEYLMAKCDDQDAVNEMNATMEVFGMKNRRP